MRCSRCQTENREGRRFCAECGAELDLACPACGWRNEPMAKFCGGCGKHLKAGSTPRATLNGPPPMLERRRAVSGTPSRAPRGQAAASPERRQLTVMFCDLVGSTALSARLDPEDLREVIRSYQDTCAAVVTRFEGVVAHYMGDGIVVHFGYPRAHEDDAERAVRAGLGIVAALAAFNAGRGRQQGVELAVRIGVATGLVVVGDLSRGGGEEQAVIGETPNLAARLQAVAEANTVVIASATKRLLDGLFEFEDLGEHTLKGFSVPKRAWRVLRPTRARSRFEAVHSTGLTPLVGREEEIQCLLRRWEQAKQGEGQVVLLCGESGIGKSRIIQAFRQSIAAERHIRVRLQCSPYHTHSALYPFVAQLERAAGFERDDSAEHKLDKLETLLARSTERPVEVAPLFASLLSIPTGERYPSRGLSSQQQRTRTLEALIEQMEGLAVHELVFAVFEDIHWIDPTTLELLDLVVERAQSARVLVLCTFRPDFSPRWTGQAHVTLLALNRLKRRQCANLVQRLIGGKTLPEPVIEQIVTKTDGVPLFVEELTKTILASGLLAEEGERYVLSGPLPPLAIPTTLQDSLMARLDQLASVKEVAQIGAAIGREFSYELLAVVSGIADERLRDALVQLTDSGLISRRGTPAGACYVFKHVLVQDAAYQSLLKSRRQQLHARIAGVLEERFPACAEIEPELLARHYTEAGLAEPALAYWVRAVRRALARSSNLEVVGHVRHALEVIALLADTPERARQELELQIALGAAYWAIKGFGSPEVEQSFARAGQLCERVGDTLQLVDALRGLYACYYVRGELGRARNQATAVIRLAERSRDSSYLALGRYMLGAILFWAGEFPAARCELETACSLYDPADQCARILSAQVDPGVNALSNLSWTLWVLGYPDAAVRASEQGIATARRLSKPLTLAMALAWACWTRSCCGHHSLTETLTEELRVVTREQGLAYLGACATFLEGQVLIAKDQCEAGLAQIHRAFAEFRMQSAGLGRGWATAVPAAACGQLGRAAEGLVMLTEAFAAIERQGERHWEAELFRLKGELLLAPSIRQETEAETCLRRALAIAQQQGAKSLELRAAMSLARLLREQGKIATARQQLREVYDWFTEGFDTADLKAARELLERLA